MAADNNFNLPVIFLAFANDRIDLDRHLRNLVPEQDGIRKALRIAREKGLCQVVERANTSIDHIFEVFQEYQDRIAIFHYGGHADSYRLLLEDPGGGQAAAHSEGLVSFLGRQKGLQLVFINGCCSQRQAQELTRAGVPAVIGTTGSIEDDVAAGLAIRFYYGLAEGHGRTLERAWGEACDRILTERGTTGADGTRDVYYTRKDAPADRFPWEIYYRRGAESVQTWSLPRAANRPLFGMPEISDRYYRQLPPAPFIGLNYFTRELAPLFFGRGKQIRELYDCLKGIQPVILFYGQSGVGKSSLLFAGLVPRIEADYAVLYIRRLAGVGLEGSLRQALQAAAGEAGLEGLEKLAPEAQWPAIERHTGKPLVLILDQAEEAYTRPLPAPEGGEREWEAFLAMVSKLFPVSGGHPRGKLILSYRKEYNPEISKAFNDRRLAHAPLFLQPLDRAGIIEAVEGVANQPELRARYRLQIAAPEGGGSLAETIAGDLCRDPGQPVAPVLQILLTHLWQRAKQTNSDAPVFTLSGYEDLKQRGLAIKDFLNQQLEKLRAWNTGMVDSGLVLDLLRYHTTEMGTAGSRSWEDIRDTYGAGPEIEALIARCQELYLLAERDQGSQAGLAHDTLAPEVRRRYEASERPGQRAARLLEGKMRDLRAEGRGVYLNGRELRTVARGKEGMRHFNEDEARLVQASRRHQQRQWLSGLVISTVLLLLLWLGYQNATEANDYANAEKEATKVLGERNYYDGQLYPKGAGFANSFVTFRDSSQVVDPAVLPADSQVVYDVAARLYWLVSASPVVMNFEAAARYVAQLNQAEFSGYHDWRLPEWDEAMSLMQRDTTAAGLHLDTLFAAAPHRIWTSSRATSRKVWRVDFRRGRMDGVPEDSAYYVWAVRPAVSGKPFQGQLFAVKVMLQENGYFDRSYNPGGPGIDRQIYPYEPQAGDSVIYDPKTNLSWQASGSNSNMTFGRAVAFIADSLNSGMGYAGFTDWRLPTLEEAMSLMESERKGNGLHIDTLFDANQSWIWTSEQPRASAAWCVYFPFGGCKLPDVIGFNHYVRAVRVGQSSR